MPTNANKRGRIYGIIAIILGTVIVVQAFPLFISSVLLIPGNPVLNDIQKRKSVDAKDLQILIDSRRDALGWYEKGRTWTDLGLGHLVLSEQLEGEGRRIELERAKHALRSGLAMAPANPYAWIRLALVLEALEGPSESAAKAVSMGLKTGPYESLLVFPKLKTGLPVWDQLDEGDRLILTELVRSAWKTDPDRTTALLNSSTRGRPLLEILEILPAPQ